MKKKISLLVVFFGILFSSNAQVFDLTTGSAPSVPGNTDPIWTLQGPGGGGFGPVNVSTGSLQFNGSPTVYPNTYAQNNCGQWITPWINAANHVTNIPGTAGTFTYRMTFTIDDCVQNPTAILDLPFMAADNSLTAIRVNNVAQAIPGSIFFSSPSSMTSNPTVVNGVNVVEVDVLNNSSFTALQLCGNITVTGDDVAPTNLDCCEALSGEVLSWGAVPGAIGYQVIIQWNDPECCQSSQLPTESLYTVTGNSFVLPNPTVCHSWKVRAIFPNNCFSDFSIKQCGCFPIKGDCEPPMDLNCEIQQNSLYLSWAPVPGVTNYEIEINYNDPACCETTNLPYTNVFTTASNFHIVANSGECFSWRVRSICKDGTRSAWSVTRCSCGFHGKQEKGDVRSNTIQGKDVKVTLKPNPAEESVSIMVLNPAVTDNCELVILDLSGSVVHQSSIKMNQENRIDLTSFKPGMYICNVNADGKVISTDKLVIK
ncbi:MAG: hypothetical protein ACJASQ_001887 [Crocinitomicaceae bacterium]|jgi:hypothetical protein